MFLTLGWMREEVCYHTVRTGGKHGWALSDRPFDRPRLALYEYAHLGRSAVRVGDHRDLPACLGAQHGDDVLPRRVDDGVRLRMQPEQVRRALAGAQHLAHAALHHDAPCGVGHDAALAWHVGHGSVSTSVMPSVTFF